MRDEIKRRKKLEKDLRNDRLRHVPQAVRDYLEVVRTAKRLQGTNPTLADGWREKAYIALYELLEVCEWATLLNGGFPEGVEDIESLPGLRRHSRTRHRDIVADVLNDFRNKTGPFAQTASTEVDAEQPKAMLAGMKSLLAKVNRN